MAACAFPLASLHQPAYARPADCVPLGDLRQRHPTASILHNLLPIYVEPCPADLTTLQSCPSHATFHALDDQTSFKLGNRSDDDDHGATQRAGGVDVFSETNEADVQMSEFVQDFEEMFYRTSHAVEGPNHHNVESPAPCIGHKLIETGALGFRPADGVGVLADDFVPATGSAKEPDEAQHDCNEPGRLRQRRASREPRSELATGQRIVAVISVSGL